VLVFTKEEGTPVFALVCGNFVRSVCFGSVKEEQLIRHGLPKMKRFLWSLRQGLKSSLRHSKSEIDVMKEET